MKLFWKIFLQAIAGLLVVSQVTLGFYVYESRKQRIDETVEYEQSLLYRRQSEFMLQLEKSGFTEAADEKHLAAIEAFRKNIGSSGALYYTGNEIYNSSPYEFDYEGLINRSFDDSKEYEVRVRDRHLLVFSSDLFREYRVIYYKDITNIYDQTRKLFIKGFFMSLGLFILAGGLMFAGIRRAMLPLMKLKEAAVSIAAGNYGACVPLQGRDEIAQLADSFNHMSAAVQENIDTLTKTNEMQRRLLGSLAHELKTPMTAIIGYADTLLTVRLNEQRRQQALQYIEKECRRLSRLSAKMLELTGLYEERQADIEMKEQRMEELLLNVNELLQFRLLENQNHLKIFCSPSSLSRKMDMDMMTSLLLNLVDNACKASSKGGEIVIRASESEISVQDFGKGIPGDEIEKVTEAFYMVDKSRSRNAGGSGLGLALCREIARLHHAELVIESGEGIGTTVRVVWKKEEDGGAEE